VQERANDLERIARELEGTRHAPSTGTGVVTFLMG
jgi:hypothetical protein